MPKSKKRTYRRQKTIKRKPKRSKRAGMYAPDLSFFTDFSDAKNSMIGANKAEELKDRIHYIKEDISDLEEDVNLLKAYLRYNKNRKTKVMPTKDIKDILRGKDLYDMSEATPRREAQRYYDLLEDEYDVYNDLLKKKRRQLKNMERYFKGLDSYYKHAEKHEKRIGVYKSEAPTGNF